MQRIEKESYFVDKPFTPLVNATLNRDDAILAASDALYADTDEQEQKLLLARCGKWHPLALIEHWQ